MESMIGSLVKSFAMNPQMANLAMGAVSKMFLQKSNPKTASKLLSGLPNDMTNEFDDNDRRLFTTTQENIDRYDILIKLSEITNIKDIDKLDNLTDIILDNIRNNTQINTADGIDKQELFLAMQDLYKQNKRRF